MHTGPPAQNITMRHYHARDIALEGSVVVLAEVKEVRLDFANKFLQVCRRGLHVFFRVLHPLKLESSRAVVQARGRPPSTASALQKGSRRS